MSHRLILSEDQSYLAGTKSKSKAENRHGPHTAAKSEIAVTHYPILLNSRTNRCFAFTELPRSP